MSKDVKSEFENKDKQCESDIGSSRKDVELPDDTAYSKKGGLRTGEASIDTSTGNGVCSSAGQYEKYMIETDKVRTNSLLYVIEMLAHTSCRDFKL